jgi:hypothetical protein
MRVHRYRSSGLDQQGGAGKAPTSSIEGRLGFGPWEQIFPPGAGERLQALEAITRKQRGVTARQGGRLRFGTTTASFRGDK